MGREITFVTTMFIAVVLLSACGVKGRPEAPLVTEKSMKKKELKAKEDLKKKKNVNK